MSEFTVTTTDFMEEPGGRFRGYLGSKTSAGIIVKPPITPGPAFKDTILGQDHPTTLNVEMVVRTQDATVFVAESTNSPDSVQARTDIERIAARIGQLANFPETVLEMRAQNVFPDPHAGQAPPRR
jgi:hypothetical protein